MDQERRIVLIGTTGAGKSATGNTILGRNAFRSAPSLDSVTEHCEHAEAEIGGNRVRVVDTPGFFDTKLPRDKIALELGMTVYLSQPGVHAFILVFKYEPFTDQQEEIFIRIQEVFGEQVIKHMIVLFTHAEGVREEETSLLKSWNEHLRWILDQCGGRFHIFNNTEPQNRQQVTELLQKIDRMVQQNRGGFYTNEMYEGAQHSTWEEFWEKFESSFSTAARVIALAVLMPVAAVIMGVASAIKGLFRW